MLLTSLTLALAISPSCTIDEQVATPEISIVASPVSYTHLTLPTNREV